VYRLAGEAGLQKHDFVIVGISGGAALAILLATKFEAQHVGGCQWHGFQLDLLPVCWLKLHKRRYAVCNRIL